MLLVLLEWCSSKNQLTSYKSYMTKIIWTTQESLLFHSLAEDAKNNGNDDSDDDTHSRNYGGLGPNFKNRLDWKVKLVTWKSFYKLSSLRNLNTAGSKERERAEEWTGLMPVYPIHSKLFNFQYFGECTVTSFCFIQLCSNFQNLLIFYQVTSTTFQSKSI